MPAPRVADLIDQVRGELALLDAPLTAPGRPSRTAPSGWSYGYSPEIDRTSYPWAVAYRLLTDHQPNVSPVSHLFGADAVLRELRTPGIAHLHRGLAGRPIDYRYTPCPYCGGSGDDPTDPNCADLGCNPTADIADHPHGCPVCDAEVCDPDYYGSVTLQEADEQLAAGVLAAAPPRRLGKGLRVVATFAARLVNRRSSEG